MDIFNVWFNELKHMPDAEWVKSIQVQGVCKKNFGIITPFAEVTLQFDPGEQFKVINLLSTEISQIASDNDWYDQIIYGVIDVMLPFPITPIKNIVLSIIDITFNEKDSVPMAFRLAARDAALKPWKLTKKDNILN